MCLRVRRLLTSPECVEFSDDASAIFLSKFLLTHVSYIGLNVVLLLPKVTGKRRRLHATNAMVAVWTIALGPLIKSCMRAVDCSEGVVGGVQLSYLVAMPEIECWPADGVAILDDGTLQNGFWLILPLGLLLLLAYTVAVPAILFARVRAGITTDKGETTFNADHVISYGWLLLRYKPSRWWFEFPLCMFKIVVICSSQLMGSDELAFELLFLLVVCTTALLLLVMVDLPYRDKSGTSGMTHADKLQILVLAGQLANYGVAYWCLTTKIDRRKRDVPLTATTGSYLSVIEQALVSLAAVVFILGPVLPPWYGYYKDRKNKQRQLQQEEDRVSVENPVHDEGGKLNDANKKTITTKSTSGNKGRKKNRSDASKQSDRSGTAQANKSGGDTAKDANIKRGESSKVSGSASKTARGGKAGKKNNGNERTKNGKGKKK